MAIQEILSRVSINQNWPEYSPIEHQTWSDLYQNQISRLEKIACREFIDGLKLLDLNHNGIPDFDNLNPLLNAQTGWKIIAVKGLISDEDFFELLAHRIFPAGQFIRTPEQFDYISEPDIFHDVFGHVPLLTNPIFADYMQAYGKGGMKAMNHNCLHELARLYWYTVEFGLLKSQGGFKIYGAGILSSPKESEFSVFSELPNRIHFNLERIMKTDYNIDRLQEIYFIIDSFNELFDATLPDCSKIYEALRTAPSFEPSEVFESDRKY